MAKFLGVEDGRVYPRVGRFDPDTHKGVDVFAPAGSRVYVPKGWRLKIIRNSYHPVYYKGSGYGWVEICGRRFGIVAAHFAEAPEVGEYEGGDLLGRVAGEVQFTPHIHWALARDHIPPPGEVDPVRRWRRCIRQRRRRGE